jgi:CheY-like chemotaxis protein
MWWKFSAEKLLSEIFLRESAGKMPSRRAQEFFQRCEFPISIGGTLHPPTSPLRFFSLCILEKENFLIFPGARISAGSPLAETRMKPKRTILCVDVNEQALSIRKVMLETRGYHVVTCTSGQEALERFKKGGVDLVLTDLMMPGLDGTKLIDEVKSLSPQTPAILLAGKVKLYDRDTKADVFLPKGMYAPVELLERIRVLLVRKRGPKRPQARLVQSSSQTSAA